MSENKPSKSKNIHSGHRERMRERFLKNGIDSLQTHEVLEFLLYFVNKRKNTNGIAHNLIIKFGTLSKVLEATPEALSEVDGVGKTTVVFIKLLAAVFNRISTEKAHESIKFNNIADLFDYCKKFFVCLANERMILISLDNKGSLISWDIISDGTVNTTPVNIKKIVETVLKHNASSVIITHNHPRGSAEPSSNDIAFTSNLFNILDGMNVRLIDHIICGENDYTSMQERSYLSQAALGKLEVE